MYDYKQKGFNTDLMNKSVLNRTLTMFDWSGLPDTLPQVELERMLQTAGYAFVFEHEGNIYCATGGLGGLPDTYNRPTEIVISIPYLKLTRTFKLESDGVLIRSDDFMLGLTPIIDKYNTFMMENEINLMMAGVNSRTQAHIVANDDKSAASARMYLQGLQAGEVGVIADNPMLESIRVHDLSSRSDHIKSLIEYQQYLKATLYNELGLQSNFNMKRERLTEGEVESVEDTLYPLIENMERNRLDAARELNEVFDLDVTVRLDSVWERKLDEMVELEEVEEVIEVVDEPEEIVEEVEDDQDEQNVDGDSEGSDDNADEVVETEEEVEPEPEEVEEVEDTEDKEDVTQEVNVEVIINNEVIIEEDEDETDEVE